MKKIKNAIILAGGDSTRFWPLSQKNLYVFNGKPLIQHQIEKLLPYVEKIIIVTNKTILEDVRDVAKNYSIDVILQEGKEIHSAILTAMPHINGEVLIVNANDVYDQSVIKEIAERREIEKCDGYEVVIRADSYIPGGYITPEGENVISIIEKPDPDKAPSKLVKLIVDYYKDTTGIFNILKNDKNATDGSYEKYIVSYIKKGAHIKYIEYKEKWALLKYPWHVLDVASYYLEHSASYRGKNVTIAPSAVIIGDVHIEDGVIVHEHSKIVGPCYIGKNTIIGNYSLVLQSTIGKKCIIGGYSEITRSYLGDDVATHRCYIGDSVIEGHSNFGAGSVTANYRFDKKNIHVNIKGKDVDTERTKLGLFTGQGVQMGVNSCTMPGRRLAKDSRVMPGEVVREDKQ